MHHRIHSNETRSMRIVAAFVCLKIELVSLTVHVDRWLVYISEDACCRANGSRVADSTICTIACVASGSREREAKDETHVCKSLVLGRRVRRRRCGQTIPTFERCAIGPSQSRSRSSMLPICSTGQCVSSRSIRETEKHFQVGPDVFRWRN